MKRLLALFVLLAPTMAFAQTPPTGVYGLDLTANNSQAVSSAGHLRLRYNSGTNQLEQSVNGAGYASLSTSFPLLAPVGSAAAPSYSFSADSTTGVWDVAGQLELQTSAGIVEAITAPGGTITELYVTAGPASGGDAVIQMNGGQAVEFKYRIVNRGSGAGMNNWEVWDNTNVPRLQIDGGTTSLVFPNTSSTNPVKILNSGGTLGTNDSNMWVGPNTSETIHHESFANALRMQSVRTGANTGEVLINTTCSIDNTANNSGHFALGCSVPLNGSQSSSIAVYTNDNAPFSGTGMYWCDADNTAGYTSCESDNTTGFQLNIFNNSEGTRYGQMQITSTAWTLAGTQTTAGKAQITADATTSQTVSGGAAFSAYNDSASTGQLYVATTSGTAHVFGFGESLNCASTCTAGHVVVWNGTNAVNNATASANLTTIAGVALQAGTTGAIVVARRGRTLVNCDAGVAAGNLVGTSGTTAGNVAASTPGAGAIVGRATEATGGTVAGQCIVDLGLN